MGKCLALALVLLASPAWAAFPWQDSFTDLTNWAQSGWTINASGQAVSNNTDAVWIKPFDFVAYGPDYYSQVDIFTLPTMTGQFCLVGGRYYSNTNQSNVNYYAAQIIRESGGNYTIRAAKRVNNGSILGVGTAVTNQVWNAGDTLRLEMASNVLTVVRISAGVPTTVITATDTADSNQEIAGTVVLRADNLNCTFDNFEAGFLTGVKNVVTVLSGHSTSNSAKVGFSISHPATVQLQYTTDATFSTGVSSSSSLTLTSLDSNDAVATGNIALTGLQPSSTYYYRVLVDGVVKHHIGSIGYPSFNTAPPSGLVKFSFAFGACNDETNLRELSFDSIRKHPGVKFWINLGDLTYADNAHADTEAKLRQLYRSQQAGGTGRYYLPRLQRAVNTYVTWDDHDFGVGGLANKTILKNTLDAYYFGAASTPIDPNEVYRTWIYGNVGFFLLDGRTLETTLPQSRIGPTQMSALKSWLLSNNSLQFKFILTSTAPDAYDQGDAWGSDNIGFMNNDLGTGPSPASGNLAQYIKQNNIGGVVFLSGDRHYYRTATLRNQEGLNLYSFMSAALNKGSYGPMNSARIDVISRSSNVVSIRTDAKHNLLVGERVYVYNVTGGATAFNGGPFTVLSTPTITTLTYAQTGPNESGAIQTGDGTIGGRSILNSEHVLWQMNDVSHYGVVTVDTTISDPTVTFAVYGHDGVLRTNAYTASGSTQNATITVPLSVINEGLVPVSPPTITSISPTSGPVGTSVSLTGTNLTGATAVTFNGTPASYTVNSATAIVTSVPIGATSGTIAVTTPGGTALSGTSFTVIAAPIITSFSPTNAPVGTSVTITGSGLSGATRVTFDGRGASFTVASPTQISAVVPLGATDGPIAVTTSGGTAVSDSMFVILPALSGGYRHTCALTVSGGLKCWGLNDHGQLGDGTTTTNLRPVDVSGLSSGVVTVSASYDHTCALTSTGGVKCWGSNFNGQLGDGTTTDRVTPTDVAGLGADAVDVSAGESHTCALTSAGGVKCWGDNGHGQLGDGTNVERLIPVDVTGLTSNVVAVGAHGTHTCALTIAGGVKCWGSNASGELGDGTTADRSAPVDVTGLTTGAMAIAVSHNEHTCALTTAGGVMCWGSNNAGQLGDGTTTTRLTPVGVGTLATGAVAITTGGDHTCALTEGGGVKCWGDNSVGQLGDGTATTSSTPVDVSGMTSGVVAVAAGGGHTCALTTAGVLFCWGYNAYGQLGDGTTVNRATPVGITNLISNTPTITGFSPTSGPIGTSVTITGTNFFGTSGVTFNGTAASYTVNSAIQITATVPGGATSGIIAVTTQGGTATAATPFTVTSPPTITSFSPTSGPVGTSVTITGTNFTGATAVRFNGTSAAYSVRSSSQIVATVPAGATTGPIAVTTPAGAATSSTNFTLAAPTITVLSPTSGGIGTSVTITGTNLTGATAVTFNGAAASYTVNSPTQIVATVPAGATTGPIAVTTPGGTAIGPTFTVVPPPTISSFSPTSGPVGTSVVINGTNFAGTTAVTFNGKSASFTLNSATRITASVPHGAKTGPISVTTPGGTVTSASSFTVTR